MSSLYSTPSLNDVALVNGAFTVPIFGPDGSVSAPTYSFTSATDAGMWMNGTSLALNVGGAAKLQLAATQITAGDDIVASSNNSLDLGLTATRWRRGYFATQVDINVATGTAPLVIASQTQVTNLNSSLLGGRALGTSGATVPLCSSAVTWSANQTLSVPGTASWTFFDSTGGSSFVVKNASGTFSIVNGANTMFSATTAGKINIGYATGGAVSINNDADFADNTGTRFGTGTDTEIVYTGTDWDFSILVATTAIRFNAGLIDTDFQVYGNTKQLLQIDANGAVSWFKPDADLINAFEFRDTAGNVDITYDSTNARLGIGVAPAYTLDVNGKINTPGTTGNTYRWNAGTAAPATNLTPVFTSYYGGNTNALGDPVAWALIEVNGTDYKVPLYT